MFFVEPAIPNEPPIEVQDQSQNQQDPQEEPRSNPINPNEVSRKSATHHSFMEVE